MVLVYSFCRLRASALYLDMYTFLVEDTVGIGTSVVPVWHFGAAGLCLSARLPQIFSNAKYLPSLFLPTRAS